ncbi:MAG TPA: ABC transporter ATP-binding protein [Stellaceae bacterium]|jgi:branched-chain amino acid transport system ATP-binding protein|nr:ABC transporter ATP-binding protein [Stellaceae bacterium]
MTELDALLAVDGVSVFYGNFRAIDHVDIAVAAGEIVSIIGANGAGKSTLLKAIIGQADRVEGRIEFAGADIVGRATRDIVAAGIMLVPEGRRLFPSLTVEENLQLGWDVGRKGEFGFADIWKQFPMLEERRKQKAGSLSGGQQQMVALGRALLANPRLLLCDEISLGLAPLVVNELYALIPRIKARGIGILIVEQDIERSLTVADRFYCLLEGKVSLTGRPKEVGRDLVMKHYFGI